MLRPSVVAAQPVGCCESFYYCYDLAVQDQAACEPGQTREVPAPDACNLWTRQCDVPTWSAQSCLGDCDRDGAVDVSEVIRGVDLALGTPRAPCGGFGDGAGHVGVDGLVRAVTHVLNGCPRQTVQCGGAPSRASASLCGPADRPCAVLADSTLSGSGVIAVDRDDQPHALLGADNGAISYARPSADGTWRGEPTGFRGAPVWLDVTDAPLALVNSVTSASHAELWRRDDDAWRFVDSAPDVSAQSGSVQRDGGGCLHALISTVDPPTGSSALAYAVHTDFWSYLGYVNRPGTTFVGGLGLDGLGDPAIAYWEPVEADRRNRTLVWRHPAGPREPIADVQSTLFIDESVRMAFSGDGAGQPHIVATRAFPGLADQSGVELIYATRVAPRTTSAPAVEPAPAWSVQVAAQGSADEFNPWRCEAPPGPGTVCAFSYDSVRALGLVASRTGDVRLFYVRQHISGRITGDCSSGPCTRHDESSTDGTLYVVWPENGALAQAVVREHFPYFSGTAVVDERGRVHLLASDFQGSRYLMLGTAPSTP